MNDACDATINRCVLQSIRVRVFFSFVCACWFFSVIVAVLTSLQLMLYVSFSGEVRQCGRFAACLYVGHYPFSAFRACRKHKYLHTDTSTLGGPSVHTHDGANSGEFHTQVQFASVSSLRWTIYFVAINMQTLSVRVVRTTTSTSWRIRF